MPPKRRVLGPNPPPLPPPTERLAFRWWSECDEALALALWGDDSVTALIGGPFDHDAVLGRLATEVGREQAEGVQYWPVFLREGQEGAGEHVGAVGLRGYTGDVRSHNNPTRDYPTAP